MKSGTVCLVEYPFTDGTGAKVRPVIVVSRDTFNVGADIVVVPISSRPDRTDPNAIFIDDTTPLFPDTGLRFSSSVKWTKPFTIEKKLLMRRLGKLEGPLYLQIIHAIVGLFSENANLR